MTNLHTAASIQRMAANEGNQRMATAMTVLSVGLLGVMFFKELSHVAQEQMRRHDEKCRRKDKRR